MSNSRASQQNPIEWGARLGGAPSIDFRVHGRVPALIRRWRDIEPAIDQSALDHHYISIHLGGPKRLHRTGEGHHLVEEVNCGAYSVTPAGADFRWLTEGPVDFMHIYISPGETDHFILENFERDPRSVTFEDALGCYHPLVCSIGQALCDELAPNDGSNRPFLDDLIHLLLFQILRSHSNVGLSFVRGRHAIAPFRLRQAIDFMIQHLEEPIGLAQIAAIAGISPFHFSRTFRAATGKSPHAYLIEQRIEKATLLMRKCDATLAVIARDTGFSDAGHFSRTFRKLKGCTPREYRRQI